MLDTQYRMHPTISRFPAGEFYEHKLRDGIHNPSELRPPQSMHLKAADDDGTLPSVIFLDHTGNESKRGNSRLNWNEAHIICSIAEDLLLHNPVGLLTAE
jgi:superfamily I DNA and/or RNA helicase